MQRSFGRSFDFPALTTPMHSGRALLFQDSHRTLIHAALLAGLLLVFPALSPAALQAQDQITLRVASWASAEEVKLETRIVEAFMQRHPGVRVELESIPSGYREKILTAIAAGTVADVFLLDSPIIPALLNKNLLLDLRPYADSLGHDLEAFFPSVLSVYSRGEALYAFPKDFTPLAMVFNKRLFDEAGLPYPEAGWTWQDYLTLAQRLTQDTDGDGNTDRYGTAFSNKLYLWQPWIWMNGGDILDPTGQSAEGFFNSPATEEALRFLIDLRRRHRVVPNEGPASDQGNLTTLFYSGRVGMMATGHWSLIGMKPYMATGELSIGVAPLPTPPGGRHTTVIYAAGWCVPRVTKHPEWAVRLAAFLSSEEAARIRTAFAIGVPARQVVAAEQVVADTFGVEAVWVEEAAFGRQTWGTRVDAFSQVERITEDAVEEVLIGGRNLHEAFTEGALRVDDMLQREAALTGETSVLTGNREILRFLVFGLLAWLAWMALSLVLAHRRDRHGLATGYAFLAPSFLLLLVFVLVPLAFSLYLSFHQWNVVSAAKPFVGLDNFRLLFHDRLFWRAFWNTALYTLHVPAGMVLALGIAVLLKRDIRGVNVWRTIFFLPSISSFVAVAMVWRWMYHPEFGLANYTLRLMGLNPAGWLSDPSTALLSVMVVNIWLGLGYQMVIFHAGLTGIPEAFYESAVVDGAGSWQRFRYITLPLLRPTTFFVLITSVIGSFQVFTLVYVMTRGGPLGSTDVVVYHIYQNAYDYLKMGYASAMAWVLFLVILAITWLQFRFLGKKVSYG